MARSNRVVSMMIGERPCKILSINRWVLYIYVAACELASARTHSTYTRTHRGQQRTNVHTHASQRAQQHAAPHTDTNVNTHIQTATHSAAQGHADVHMRAHTRMMFLLRCVPGPKLAEGVGDPATCLPTTLEAAWLTWHLFCIENLAWPKTSQNVAQHGRLGVRRGWRCVAMTRSSRVEFMMLGERSCRILYIIRWVLYFSVEACGARMCIAM